MPLKKKTTPKAKLSGCKGCGKELEKIDFNSRSKAKLYVHVCDKPDCNLYRYFQGHEGPIPEGLNIIEV